MLPYSPLHHLLLARRRRAAGADERQRLRRADRLRRRRRARAPRAAIADLFLVHDRPIHMRTDDSVVRAVRGRRRAAALARLRARARAAAAARARPLLACGAELKNTFCVARGDRAWVSHHIGDLRNYETLRAYREGVAHFERLFAVRPEVVAHDLHPDYLSTAYALEREGVEPVGVQHHHAHLAACLAEHGVDRPGGGRDLRRHRLRHRRHGLGRRDPRRRPARLRARRASVAGAHARRRGAVREPWRMACAWLRRGDAGAEPPPPAPARRARALGARRRARPLAASPRRVPRASGRLFDAVAALCGLRTHATYEGQAAVELEALADRARARRLPAAGSTRDAAARRARGRARGGRPSARAGVPVGDRPRASTARLARPRRAAARGRARGGPRARRARRAASSRTRCCWSDRDGALEACGLRVLVPERAAAQRRRDRLRSGRDRRRPRARCLPITRLTRTALDWSLSAAQGALLVRDDARPFALIGRWAGGGALIGSEPVRVAGAGDDPFALLDELPRRAARERADGAVGGGWFGYLGYGLGRRIEPVGAGPAPAGAAADVRARLLRPRAAARRRRALVVRGAVDAARARGPGRAAEALRARAAAGPPAPRPFATAPWRCSPSARAATRAPWRPAASGSTPATSSRPTSALRARAALRRRARVDLFAARGRRRCAPTAPPSSPARGARSRACRRSCSSSAAAGAVRSAPIKGTRPRPRSRARPPPSERLWQPRPRTAPRT